MIIWILNVKLSAQKASGFSSDVCICFRSFHGPSSSSHTGDNHWTTLNGNWQQKSPALRACWEKCTNNCIYLLLPHSQRCLYNEAHTPPACRRERGRAGQVENKCWTERKRRNEGGLRDGRQQDGVKASQRKDRNCGKTSVIFTAGPLCNWVAESVCAGRNQVKWPRKEAENRATTVFSCC